MYGYLPVDAESWDEAIEKAEAYDTPLPTDGSYVEASFEVDHDIIEFEREDERQQIRRKVDKGFPTGNEAEFGTSME